MRICEISYQPSTCSYRLSSPLGQFNIGPGSAACGTNTRSNQRAYWTGRSRSFSSRHAGSVDLTCRPAARWGGLGCALRFVFRRICGRLGTDSGLYVVLLEMVVFPFIVSSCCMGSAACVPPRRSGCCERAGQHSSSRGAAHWPLCGCCLKQFLRPVRPLVVTADRGQGASQLVSLLVPANPFADLSRNCVPAIVAFCVFYGIAIVRIENKQGILSGLEVVKHASVTIWK